MKPIDTPEQLDAWLAANPVPPGGTPQMDEWKADVRSIFSVRHDAMLIEVLGNQHNTGASYAVSCILRMIGYYVELQGSGRSEVYQIVKPDNSIHFVHPRR